MTSFRYRAARPSGEVVDGTMTASSKGELIARLCESGLVPIRAEEAGASGLAGLLGMELFAGRRVPRKQLAIVTRGLATLLQAGIELERALEVTVSLADKPALRRMFAAVLDDIRAGRSLADALEAHEDQLPASYIGMVRAGEAGGALDIVFARLAEFIERGEAAREQLRSALIYPVLLLMTAIASVIVIVTVVLPQFEPLFAHAGRKLPFLTRALLATSHGVEQYGWIAALALLAAFLALRWRLRDPATRLAVDRRLLRLPLVGDLIVKIEAARLTRTLGTLLQNGVATLGALDIARATLTNSALAADIAEVTQRVRSGRGMADALAETSDLPQLAAQLIRIGDEAGRLEEMLLRTADIFEAEAQRSVQRLLALLLPALTALLGVFIALIIASIFLAIVNINTLAF